MPDVSEMLSLAEYAAQHGIDPSSVRKKILRGKLPAAVKVGSAWLIPRDAQYTDHRVRSGNYRNWRRKDPDTVSE